MSAWNPEKVAAFREAFTDFLGHLKIDSKETGGRAPLVPYGAQLRFLDGIFDGLAADAHHFVILKARQLGITTISLALDLFWLGMIDGLQGALIFDTDGNKEKARVLFNRYMESLPRSLNFPRIAKENRYGLVLSNGSVFDYLVAGIKKTTGSAGLGVSRGFNFVHATECSRWGDLEGLRSLERTLAESFPDRLYIFESTARGYNLFHDMWRRAKADDLTKRAIFIGWWAKEAYSFKERTPEFERYGRAPPSPDEQAKIDLVQQDYGVSVGMNQLAWYRHEDDPENEDGNNEEIQAAGDILDQELPWHEDDAFLMSGSTFFSGQAVSEAAKFAAKVKFRGYRYQMGEDFLATHVETVRTYRDSMLRVWEEPDPTGVYVIGADPAYGSDDTADRYCAQVLRCYADGLDQVAEFCTPVMTTYQFAWVVSHLCGAYANARLVLEINGPGQAVMNEFRTLRTLLQAGYMRSDAERRGLRNMFDNVRQYLYHRMDSLGAGQALHFKTTTSLKVGYMNQLRDSFQMKQLRVRSLDCLEEMRHIEQDGDSIRASQNYKDDRVIALALAVRAWIDGERENMITQQRTRANEAKRATMGYDDMTKLFHRQIVGDFFARQKFGRQQEARAQRRQRWNW